MRRITIIYQGTHGFVTDIGEDAEARTLHGDDGSVIVLPRYGVWRRDGLKHEVVAATDDVAEARTTVDQE